MPLECQEAEAKSYIKFYEAPSNSQLPLWREKVFKDDTAFQAKFIQP